MQELGSAPPIVLRMCYAMSGTDLGSASGGKCKKNWEIMAAPGEPEPHAPLALSRRPVLTQRVLQVVSSRL